MNTEAVSKIRNYLNIIVQQRGATGGLAMGDALRQLDEIAKTEADNLDPQLRHFLEKRSYEKALAFLDSSG